MKHKNLILLWLIILHVLLKSENSEAFGRFAFAKHHEPPLDHMVLDTVNDFRET